MLPRVSERGVSIIIPALNEDKGIAEIIQRTQKVIPEINSIIGEDVEIIVVDDGSTDSTSEVVRCYPGVRLIQHKKNQGYGAALKTGFKYAKGSVLAFLDADGTYPPEHFPRLIQFVMNGYELVIGSRRSGALSKMPVVRRAGNYLWSLLVTMLCGQRVIDPASGMRVFHRDILERIYPLPDGLNFTPLMSLRAINEGVKQVEIPIPYEERKGRSKLSVVHDGMRFLETILWTALHYNPVRIFGFLGMSLLGVSTAIALGLVLARLFGISRLGPVGVALTFIGVDSGLTGINLFALGVTFNYLVSIFHKRRTSNHFYSKLVRNRPLETHFGWLGMLLITMGFLFGMGSFALALNQWPIERLWLYLLAGSMMILVGVQLIVFWIIILVLGELRIRESLVQNEFGVNENVIEVDGDG